MDFILFQRMRSFHLFVPRSSRLTLLFNKSSNVATCQKLPFLEKRSDSICCMSYNIRGNAWYALPNSNVGNKLNSIYYCTSTKSSSSSDVIPPNKDGCHVQALEKPSMFQKMKQLTKDYWHILIPVHIVTSAGWLSMFYIAAKNGVDIIGILKSLNLSDRYLEMIKSSNAGHWAITYALYKIFTPLRYTVTIGGTTMCIRYLNKWGYLKFKRNIKEPQPVKSTEGYKSACNESKKKE